MDRPKMVITQEAKASYFKCLVEHQVNQDLPGWEAIQMGWDAEDINAFVHERTLDDISRELFELAARIGDYEGMKAEEGNV